MATEPAMSGEIPVGGVVEILREIEERRITGRLRFTAADENEGQQVGEVELVAGQIALDQDPLPDGSDPVERLLALRSGLFVVHQRLPPLPVSRGDDLERKGSLAVHVPADLMNYCETVGLTGLLTLTREGEVVELVYEYGELLAIRVDGRDDGDLSPVFAWEEGNFHIRVNAKARTLVPATLADEEDEHDEEADKETTELPVPEAALATASAKKPKKQSAEDSYPGAREPTTQFVRPKTTSPDDTGRQFLKVVEMALTDIVDRSEKARPMSRTSPPRLPMPTVRPRPPTLPAPAEKKKRKREPTVRVVYLTPDDPTTAVPAVPSGTIHAARGGASGEAKREEALPDARPERRSQDHDMSKKKKSASKPASEKAADAKKADAKKVDAKKADAKKADAKKAAPASARATSAEAAPSEPRGPLPGPGDFHHDTAPATSIAVGFAWVVAVFAVGLLILAFLARLPPVQ